MRLALLTCSNLPDWEQDDYALHQCLNRHHVDWCVLAWDASIEWSQFDAVLIRTTWDYVHRLPAFESRLYEIAQHTRLINPIDVVRWNIRKTYLRDLAKGGISIAPTIWVDDVIDLQSVLSDFGWEKAFLKPVVGASASDTKRFLVTDVSETQRWLNEKVTAGQSFLLQPYVESVETMGEFSTIYFGKTFSHAVRKVPVSGDYRVQDDYGASDYPIAIEDYPQIVAVSEKVMAYLHERFDGLLVARLDFLFVDGQFPVINEVELIEPSLFFRHAPTKGPEILYQQLCSLIQF